MSGSKLDLIIVCVFTLLCWLLVGLLLKPLFELWRRRGEYWFVNRRPSMTWALVAGLFFYVAVCRPLKVYCEYLLLGDDTEDAAFIVGFVDAVFMVPSFYAVIIGYCTRYWLIYFDIEIAVRCSDQRWKELLLTAPETDCQHAFDWFTAHKFTLGSWNYLKKLDAALFLIIFFAVLATYFFATALLPFLFVPVMVFCLFFIWRVTAKMPNFSDGIRVHDESVICLKSTLPFAVAYFGLIAAGIFNQAFITVVFRQANNALCFYIQLCVILLWLPRQFEPAISWQLLGQTPPKTRTQTKSMDKLLLSEIISQTDGFHVFMEHLFKEFSYENLLCCVELLQFRQLHMAAFGEEDVGDECKRETDAEESGVDKMAFTSPATFKETIENTDRVDHFQFPQQIMDLSPTISTNESLTFRRRFERLYHKYISPSAAMPVNLSFGTTQRLTTVAEKLTTDSGNVAIGCNVFDDAIVELYRVMSDSYSRFVLTDSYKLFAHSTCD